jgi:hypothetical protein
MRPLSHIHTLSCLVFQWTREREGEIVEEQRAKAIAQERTRALPYSFRFLLSQPLTEIAVVSTNGNALH